MDSSEASAAILNTLQHNKMLEAEAETLKTTIRVIEKSAMEMRSRSQSKQSVTKYPSYTVPIQNYQSCGAVSLENYDNLFSNLAKCEDYSEQQLLEGLDKDELTNAMHNIQTLAEMQKLKVESLAQEVDHLNKIHSQKPTTDDDIFDRIANSCLADEEKQRKIENNFEQRILQLEMDNPYGTVNARMQVYDPVENTLTPEVIGRDQGEIKIDNRLEKTTAISSDQNQFNQPPEMGDFLDKPFEDVIYSCKAQAEKQAKVIAALTEAINNTANAQNKEKLEESMEAPIATEKPSGADAEQKAVQEIADEAKEKEEHLLEASVKDGEEDPAGTKNISRRKFNLAALAAIPITIAGATAAGFFAYLRHIK